MFALLAGVIWVAGAGCHLEMYDQPRYDPYEVNEFFRDSSAMRPFVEGTVPHTPKPREVLPAGVRADGSLDVSFPFPISREVLTRGRERFDIFCSPCHGRVGDGLGMIVQRGFPQPPTYHSDSLRAVPVGHFVDVMTRGFGRMYSYADRLTLRDRWAVAAYIRALQLSQYTPATYLTEDDRQSLMRGQ